MHALEGVRGKPDVLPGIRAGEGGFGTGNRETGILNQNGKLILDLIGGEADLGADPGIGPAEFRGRPEGATEKTGFIGTEGAEDRPPLRSDPAAHRAEFCFFHIKSRKKEEGRAKTQSLRLRIIPLSIFPNFLSS